MSQVTGTAGNPGAAARRGAHGPQHRAHARAGAQARCVVPPARQDPQVHRGGPADDGDARRADHRVDAEGGRILRRAGREGHPLRGVHLPQQAGPRGGLAGPGCADADHPGQRGSRALRHRIREPARPAFRRADRGGFGRPPLGRRTGFAGPHRHRADAGARGPAGQGRDDARRQLVRVHEHGRDPRDGRAGARRDRAGRRTHSRGRHGLPRGEPGLHAHRAVRKQPGRRDRAARRRVRVLRPVHGRPCASAASTRSRCRFWPP